MLHVVRSGGVEPVVSNIVQIVGHTILPRGVFVVLALLLLDYKAVVEYKILLGSFGGVETGHALVGGDAEGKEGDVHVLCSNTHRSRPGRAKRQQ